MLILSQIWPVGAPSSWLLCPFDMTPSLFEHLLTCAKKTTCSRLISNSPSPCPEVGQFSFYWKMGFRNQVWLFIPFGMSLLLGSFRRQEIDVCIHTHTAVSISVYRWTDIFKKHEFTLVPPIPIQYLRFLSSFPLSLFVIPFFNSEKLNSGYLFAQFPHRTNFLATSATSSAPSPWQLPSRAGQGEKKRPHQMLNWGSPEQWAWEWGGLICASHLLYCLHFHSMKLFL